METLIIQVDCRPYGRDGPPQLGITVEDPALKKDILHQKKANQNQQASTTKEYQNHDYQNLDNGSIKNDTSSTNKQTTTAASQRPLKTVNNDHRTSSGNGLQQQMHRGLQITQIQEGSVIDRNGQFRVGDIIAEVNGVNLQRSFAEAQRTLKQFVVEHTSHGPLVLKVFRKSASPSVSSESRHLVGALNTRKIGVKHKIKLRKAVNGFGIKIAERDNMHGTRHRPIFITAITTTGSAYLDGRLKEGDMLLEVNGIDLYGKSQPEVTKMLKSISANQEVEFVVSRQENLTSDAVSDDPGVFTFDIPLNDTKSAGLGLYLKYPRRTEDHKDLGIWIEKVITGGAAWKDGRLQPDDQILAINGINLLDLSNAEASETLTAAVCRGIGPEATPNTIRLKIHRRSPTVVEKILQGTNNGIEHFDAIPAGQEKSYSTLTDKKVNNSQDSYLTALDNTLHTANNTLQTKTITNLGNSSSSSNQNSRSDSVMSPQTQASNSLGLTSSCNERLEQNSSEKTNETTSSAISQITDSNSQSWDDESTDAPVKDDPFQRDGFGRQSISEKRHAQLNAWNTDTFRRNQRQREEQEQREQQRQLEEQMARQCFEVAVDVPVDVPMPPKPKMSNERVTRNRKINESFRLAVDRSYEGNTIVAPPPASYELNGRLEQSESSDDNRRISTGTKMLSSVANSTGSTANEERYLISNRNGPPPPPIPPPEIVQESKLNDNHQTHKKSSSLLTKLIKFGSIKRKKKNKTGATTTTTKDVEPPKEIEVRQTLRQDASNQDLRKGQQLDNNNTQRYSHVQNHHQSHHLKQHHHPQHSQPIQMFSYQHQMQSPVQVDQPPHSATHPLHHHSSLYSSSRSAQIVNHHAPQISNGRQQSDALPQHPHPTGAQWHMPQSHFQSPNGLWVTNTPLAPEAQMPPSNIYATLPHPHHAHMAHHNHQNHHLHHNHHHHHQQQQTQHISQYLHHHQINMQPQQHQQQHIHHNQQQQQLSGLAVAAAPQQMAQAPQMNGVGGGGGSSSGQFMPVAGGSAGSVLGSMQQPLATMHGHNHNGQHQQHSNHHQFNRHQGQPFGAQPTHQNLQYHHQSPQQQPQHIFYYDF